MTRRRDRQETGPASAAGLEPKQLYPGGPVYWGAPAEPLGKPRPGHGTLYVNPASKVFTDSEWYASWEDDYPESEIEAHGGATAGVASISGSEQEVMQWARTSPAKKRLIMKNGKWKPLAVDENWRPEQHPRD